MTIEPTIKSRFQPTKATTAVVSLEFNGPYNNRV
jgi:hypothetical protein